MSEELNVEIPSEQSVEPPIEIEEAPKIRPRGRPRKDPPPEPKEKKPRGRPRIENPTKPGQPKLGKQYYKDYYIQKLKDKTVTCPHCNICISPLNLSNHIRSTKCANLVLLQNLQSQISALSAKFD